MMLTPNINQSVATSLCVGAILLAGCASTHQIQTRTYTPPTQDDNGAVVYFYRDVTMPTKVNLDVKVDGQAVALLPPSRFTWVRVTTGKHQLSVGYPSFPDMSAKIEMTIEPRKIYLFKYLSSAGGGLMPVNNGGGVTLVQMGSRPWTALSPESENNIAAVVSSYGYVPAHPDTH
jgi:hypothetical protein